MANLICRKTDQWLRGPRWNGLSGKEHKRPLEGDRYDLYPDCDGVYAGV